MKLNEIFKEFGKTDLMSERVDFSTKTYRGYQQAWAEWYRGYVKSFHRFYIYNGDHKVWQKRRSLNMAKTVCERWASLLMNEKTQISVSDEAAQVAIKDIFAHNKFETKLNAFIEKAFAVGMAAVVERLAGAEVDADTGELVSCENAKIKLDFISGKNIYPLTVDDDGVVECAFLSRKGKKISISLHLLDEQGNYVIHNITGKQSENGDITYNKDTDYYSFDTGSPRPWFQIIKPNIENNIQEDSPLGISVFANALSALETVDITFDSLPQEFILGKKRLYVSVDAMKPAEGEGGEMTLTFDPNDIFFYRLPQGDKPSDKPFVEESNGTLRVGDIQSGIQAALNVLSTKCGFGEGQFTYNNGTITTATQVISQNSEMFRNVKKHEKLLTENIVDCIQTVLYIMRSFTGQNFKELCDDEISVTYDDSIIEDKNAEMVRDMQQVSSRLMKRTEYRKKYFGENDDEAKASITEIDAEQPTAVDIFSMT